MKTRCPDCDVEIEIPEDVMPREILSCPCCGLELEVKQVNEKSVEIQELALEGEDWGE